MMRPYGTAPRCASLSDDGAASPSDGYAEAMRNVYREWTLEQDRELWEHRALGAPELAARLGRGLRGVERRLAKLRDVNHAAYRRLFVGAADEKGAFSRTVPEKRKLVPVSEVIRRIQWSLDPAHFTVLHYDRVDDGLLESPFTATNDSVSGGASTLIEAIPEHRIMAVKYRERVVWDRAQRMDLVFSDGGINHVIETYEEWKRRQEATEQLYREQKQKLSDIMHTVLGAERWDELQRMSLDLLSSAMDPKISKKLECEKFTEAALVMLREASHAPSSLLKTDGDALDLISEFAGLFPHEELRRVLLTEVSLHMKESNGEKTSVVPIKPLELNEDDIIETFIRGSGPGGQKINKTSNRVLLIHKPTQLRVECQETRSLQQNRKIARKRLLLKLDEYLNGSQSLTRIKASRASNKKAKAKARSRKRQRDRHQDNRVTEPFPSEEGDDFAQ